MVRWLRFLSILRLMSGGGRISLLCVCGLWAPTLFYGGLMTARGFQAGSMMWLLGRGSPTNSVDTFGPIKLKPLIVL